MEALFQKEPLVLQIPLNQATHGETEVIMRTSNMEILAIILRSTPHKESISLMT